MQGVDGERDTGAPDGIAAVRAAEGGAAAQLSQLSPGCLRHGASQQQPLGHLRHGGSPNPVAMAGHPVCAVACDRGECA